MTKRIILQQRFYLEPTIENLEALEKSLQIAADQHIMKQVDMDYIMEKIWAYYDEHGE